MAVIPWYIKQSPWALEFDKFFPDADGQWDHPSVKEALRKQALMISMQAMKGKNLQPGVQKMAEFVLQKFISTEAAPQVHVSITLDQILELKKKAGLSAEFNVNKTILSIPAATNLIEDSSSLKNTFETVAEAAKQSPSPEDSILPTSLDDKHDKPS